MNLLLPILSGILGGLAFPKASLWLLSFVFLVPLFFSLKRSDSYKDVILPSLLFGMFFFGILLGGITELYLYVSFWAYVAWAGLTLFQSLYVVAFCLFAFRLVKQEEMNFAELFVIPSLWVIIEYARSFCPFGITGGGLGYSLAGILPLIQIASFTGVYGVSFLIVLFNLVIFRVASCDGDFSVRLSKRKYEIMAAAGLILIAVIVGVCRLSVIDGAVKGTSAPLRVALIQPNVDQLTKLNFDRRGEILEKHIMLTEEILSSKPDLVIWPETAVITYLFYDRVTLSKLEELIKSSGAYFIIGAPEWDNGKAYNSAFLFSPSGSVAGRYDKTRLVPFGEYIPLRRLLYPMLRAGSDFFGEVDYGYDSNSKVNLLRPGARKLGVAICFESTFPGIIRDRVAAGADGIVVITDDAWFGESSLAYQHLDSGVLRAVECGVPLLQVGNTGLSAIVTPSGRVLKKTRLNREVAFVGEMPGGAVDTLYVRYGDIFVWALFIYVIAIYAVKRLAPDRMV